MIRLISDKKLKAATLLEVVVSLLIICMVMSIVAALYVQLIGSSLTIKKYKAIQLLEQEAILIKKDRRWENEEYALDQYTILKTVESWMHGAGMKVLVIEAVDQQGKSVAIRKELVYLP